MSLLTAQKDPQNKESISDTFTFRENVTIDSGKVSRLNMRIIGGDLIVHGTMDGKASLFGGDVILKSGSILNGEIITIGGNVFRETNITINGKIIENNLSEGLIYRETIKDNTLQGEVEFGSFKESVSQKSWIHPKRHPFKYNRNEGLVFVPFNELWDRRGLSSLRFSWYAGVRFRTGFLPDYIGRATFEKKLFQKNDFILFSSFFKESRTDDGYRLPKEENGWANFLARQDFYDRWDESGWEIGFGYSILKTIQIKTRIVSASQDSLPNWDMISLFEKKRRLRPSYSLDPQINNYLEISVIAKTQDYHPLHDGAALYFQSEYIQSESDSSTVFSMDYSKAIRRNLALLVMNWEFSEGLVFRTRFMAGSGSEAMQSHRLFGVGGLGSIDGQPYKLQEGNQMALLNLALYLTPEFTDGNWLLSFNLNGGRAWNNSSWGTRWISTTPKSAISSVGIGIGKGNSRKFNWMVNISKPLDYDGAYQTVIRFNHIF